MRRLDQVLSRRLGGALLFCLVGCTPVQLSECDSDEACRLGFGFGSVCSAEGLCAPEEMNPRCGLYPRNLSLPLSQDRYHVVGTIFDLALETHQARNNSVELAFSQATALGGRDFALLQCDNREDASLDGLDRDEASVETAVWMAERIGVSTIVGPSASTRVEMVYEAVAEQHDVLIVSPAATSTALTTLDGDVSTEEAPGLLWRTAAPDILQAHSIAADMRTAFDPTQVAVFRSSPSEQVAIVFREGVYGRSLADTFSVDFQAQGGSSTTEFSFDDDPSRAQSIAGAANGGFDEILFISSDTADIVSLLQAADTLPALSDHPLFFTDAARNSDVLDQSQAFADVFPRVRVTSPASPSGAVHDTFVVSYTADFGDGVDQQSFTSNSFDAAWLVLYAHAWAASSDSFSGTELARGLRQVSAGSSVPIQPGSWPDVQAAFASGESVDVEGASGVLDYDETGETTANIAISVIAGDGQSFLVVQTVTP